MGDPSCQSGRQPEQNFAQMTREVGGRFHVVCGRLRAAEHGSGFPLSERCLWLFERDGRSGQ